MEQNKAAIEASGLVVTEGTSGYHHYHLSNPHDPAGAGRSLCGRPVMHSGIDLADWQKPFGEHFAKKPTWCKDCAAAATGPQDTTK